MSAAEALSLLIASPSRKVLIAAAPVNLMSREDNELVVLLIDDRLSPAGGRAGGFGGRTVVRAYGFVCKEGEWRMELDTGPGSDLSDVEVPPGIARLPVVLADGSEIMAYAVIDPDALAEIKESLRMNNPDLR